MSDPGIPAGGRRPSRGGCIDRRRACLSIGGPGRIDLWDMKPTAPAEIRGEFGPAISLWNRRSTAIGVSTCWPVMRMRIRHRQSGLIGGRTRDDSLDRNPLGRGFENHSHLHGGTISVSLCLRGPLFRLSFGRSEPAGSAGSVGLAGGDEPPHSQWQGLIQ